MGLNGRLIESSWQQGPQPLYIEAGHSPEFPALGEGVIGMHEGGRRELVVPPKMNREGSEEVMTYTIELFMVSKQRGASTSRVDVRSGAILSPNSPTIRNNDPQAGTTGASQVEEPTQGLWRRWRRCLTFGLL